MQVNYIKFLITAAIVLHIGLANAETVSSQQCKRGGVIRIVELQADSASGIPCRILYHKPVEDQSTINLWNATHNAQFCESKYDAFIVKLETKLRWSCKLIETANKSSVNSQSDTESNIMRPATQTKDKVLEKSSAVTTNSLDQPAAPNSLAVNEVDNGEGDKGKTMPNVEVESDIAEEYPAIKPLDKTSDQSPPGLARALPNSTNAKDADTPLTIQLIKQYIPSGNYASNEGKLHSGKTHLCPTDGFFIWNTKSRDRPTFEMGENHTFQFKLISSTRLSVSSDSANAVIRQCEPQISAGHCSSEKYIGQTPLHPAITSYFSCGNKTGNPQRQRPLVLIRSAAGSNADNTQCAIDENYHHLALAAPSITTSGDATVNDRHDIELVILPEQSDANSLKSDKGTVCRYSRGGQR